MLPGAGCDIGDSVENGAELPETGEAVVADLELW